MNYYHTTELIPGGGRSATQLLKKILTDNTVEPKTEHILDGKRYYGMSVSRSSALPFASRIFGQVVFQLNPITLSYRNRIIPIDGNVSYRSLQNSRKHSSEDHTMAFTGDIFKYYAYKLNCCDRVTKPANNIPMSEEFIIGNIDKFSSHIIHVHLLEPEITYDDHHKYKDELIGLLTKMNIPFTEEINPGDFTYNDIVKCHINQRRKAA